MLAPVLQLDCMDNYFTTSVKRKFNSIQLQWLTVDSPPYWFTVKILGLLLSVLESNCIDNDRPLHSSL